MTDKPKVKIFVAYHKDAHRIQSDILTPIHVGRAIASPDVVEKLKDIIGDDTGDNISVKNPNYCELTALYWAWKNCDADYIGFMHYRRHMNFNSKKSYKENKWGLVDEQIIDHNYIDKFAIKDENILQAIKNVDIILPKKWNVKNANSKNNYDHYATSSPFLHIKDYDKAIQILKRKHPEYSKAVEIYNNSYYGYYTNMFIMKAEIFKEYCEWMFSILKELESCTDISHYNKESARIYGYISEWLTGIFITQKQLSKNLRIKELQRTFVHCTETENNIIPVCFSADNNYFKPLFVAIYSLLKNKKVNDEYIINIIDGGITEKNKELLTKLVKQYNTKIIFKQIDYSKFEHCPIKKTDHISVAAYYRFLLADFFPEYKQLIYLDCDLLVRTSLSELIKINMEDNYIGGVIDIICNENTARLNIEKYINSGVLIINTKKWIQEDISKKLFEYTRYNGDKIVWHDQDVLNVVLQNGIKYIDAKWNLQTAPYFIDINYTKYFSQHKDTAIIHYVSNDKPWLWGTQQPLSKEFIRLLRKTPFKLLYIKCLTSFYLQKIISYRTKGFKELKILGISIFKRTKTEKIKNITILNLFDIERPIKNA